MQSNEGTMEQRKPAHDLLEHHSQPFTSRCDADKCYHATVVMLCLSVHVRFYNKRGTAEQWIKEDKQAVKRTRLSCHWFRSNAVRLWLRVIAYNLGNL